jgi:DNA anti-recombination protein RmuC
MNEEEHKREQMRQKDMVESIARGYSRQEREKALERLSQSLEELEKVAKDLAKTTKALKNPSTLLSHG